MTCGLPGGMSVEFVESGLTFRPYEVTTRSGTRHFSHTKVTLSRKDGEQIADEALEYDSVLVRFGDDIQDRYMFHPEAVNLHNSDSTLTLYDGEKVLQEGTVNKHFQDSDLGEVFEYIIGRRQDPNGVIVDVKHPSDDLRELEVKQELGAGSSVGGIIDKTQNAIAKSVRAGSEALRNPEFASTAITLKNMSPYDAINKVADSFALDTWVDEEGYFHYGLAGAGKQSLVVGAHDDAVKLKEYNVSVGSGKLSEIILQGQYEFITNTPTAGYKQGISNVHAYGKAWLVDEDGERIEGRSLKPDKIVSASTPNQVEQAARRELINHYMDRKNGNVVLNAGASTETAALTKLAVGDLLAASSDIQDYCERTVDTGIFTVQSVQHKVDLRRGWIVEVGVAALPAADIDGESWLMNPETDQRWDSVDDFGPSIDET